MDVKKIWITRITGIVTAVFGLIFGGTIKRYQFCLGDKVFFELGLSTWTRGTTGTHYPAIIGLLLILVGIILVSITLQKRKRVIVWGALVLMLVLLNISLMLI